MARLSSKTISDRDISRIGGACEEKNFNAMLDFIVGILKEKTSIITLSNVRKELNEGSIGKHVQKHHKGSNTFQKLLERLSVTLGQWEKTESISQRWAQIYDTPDIDFQVKSLLNDLTTLFSGKLVSYPKKIGSGLWDFSMEFPDIHLKYFDEKIHLFVVCDSRAGVNEYSILKKAIRENETSLKINLVLVIGSGDVFREIAKESDVEVVVLDDHDVLEIVLSNNSRQKFCHLIAKRVSVQALQPYQTKSKVRDRMFYGRQEEIKKIKGNLTGSFSIYGGRLIGKSSLLHRIKCEFETDTLYKVCSVTKEGFESVVEVERDMLKQLSIPTGTHRSNLTFERLMRDYLDNHPNLRVFILLDEVDDIIISDEENDSKFFHILHNLNSDYGERCRFVFAGYRELARRCMDNTTRFWNFTETIRLGSLSSLQARKLVEEPLCDELGFTFEDSETISAIIEMTGSHPNYIQVFCKELSEYLEKQNRRKIRKQDIEVIFENQEFRSQITQTFRVNFSKLQKLIVATVIVEGLQDFDEARITKLLSEYGLVNVNMDEIFIEVRQLELAFVIEQAERKFQFVHKLFPEMLEKSINLYELIDVLVAQLNKERQDNK